MPLSIKKYKHSFVDLSHKHYVVQVVACASVKRDDRGDLEMADMKEMNKAIIAEFRANNGELSGPMAGAPILLLTTAGRHSGNPHTTPVGFVDAGGRLVVAAANGGSDDEPDWFINLSADPDVTVEVGAASIASRATVTSGQDRIDLLDRLAESLPGMSDYIAGTSRAIPVIELTETG